MTRASIRSLQSQLGGRNTVLQMLEDYKVDADIILEGWETLNTGGIRRVKETLKAGSRVSGATRRFEILKLGDGARTGARTTIGPRARKAAELLQTALGQHEANLINLPKTRRLELAGKPELKAWRVRILGAHGTCQDANIVESADRKLEMALSEYKQKTGTRKKTGAAVRLIKAQAELERAYAGQGDWFKTHARDNGLTAARVDAMGKELEKTTETCQKLNTQRRGRGSINWAETIKVTREAFKYVHPAAGEALDRGLLNGWVDAVDRGSRPYVNATWSGDPKTNPVALITYTDDTEGAAFASHELGHLVHVQITDKEADPEAGDRLTAEFAACYFSEMMLSDLVQERPELEWEIVDERLHMLYTPMIQHQFERYAHQQAANGKLTAGMLQTEWKRLFTPFTGPGRRVGAWTSATHVLERPGDIHVYTIAHACAVIARREIPAETVYAALRQYRMLTPGELLGELGLDITSVKGCQRIIRRAVRILQEELLEAA